jgi:hypothetical protein
MSDTGSREPRPLAEDTPPERLQHGIGIELMLPTELVRLATMVITGCARVEMLWIRAVASMAGGDPRVVTSMMEALLTTNLKVGAAKAAVEVARFDTREDKELCCAAVRKWEALCRARTPYAHHVWCYLDSMPDALILVPGKFVARVEITGSENQKQFAAALSRAVKITERAYRIPPDAPLPSFASFQERGRDVVRAAKVYTRDVISGHVGQVIRNDRIAFFIGELTAGGERAERARKELRLQLPAQPSSSAPRAKKRTRAPSRDEDPQR